MLGQQRKRAGGMRGGGQKKRCLESTILKVMQLLVIARTQLKQSSFCSGMEENIVINEMVKEHKFRSY